MYRPTLTVHRDYRDVVASCPVGVATMPVDDSVYFRMFCCVKQDFRDHPDSQEFQVLGLRDRQVLLVFQAPMEEQDLQVR